MSHFASPGFWKAYGSLEPGIRQQADEAFARLLSNAAHPSLHFKKVGDLWSARVNLSIRALAVEADGNFIWFWIGSHADYDRLIK